MNCDEARILIHGHADGELDSAQNGEVENHLESCPACAEALKNIATQRAAVSEHAVSYKAPADLTRRIRESLPRAGTPQQVPVPHISIRPPRRFVIPLAAAVCALALTFSLVRLDMRPAGDEMLTEEIFSAHVRSLMVNHLADVASTDQHTVKPWFNGKLDFSPIVDDLATEGFPLTGGRLDYINKRAVAALIYQRRQHVINLFVWPSQSRTDRAPTLDAYHGYHVIHWTKSAFDFWAISDVNEKELFQFVNLLTARSR